MAWEEELFAFLDDLEQQAAALHGSERGAELADRSRSVYAEVTLGSRLMAAVGHDVVVDLAGVGALPGRVERVADGWFLLVSGGRDWVVRTAALHALRGAPARAVPEVAWSAVSRLGIGSALRRLGEAAEPCVVHRVDGVTHPGVVRRVGADFLEVATPGAQVGVVVVALTGLAAVQGGPA